MKTVKLTGKLSLNKETVAKLNNDQMNAVQGGGTLTCNNDSHCICVTYASCVVSCATSCAC